MVVGFVALAIGMFLYTQIPVDGSFVSDLLPGYLLVGFALPFTFIPVSIAALAGVHAHEAGLASGLFNTTQQVGGAIGVAVASSVSISHFNHLTATGIPFAAGLHERLAVGVLGDGRRLARVHRRDGDADPARGARARRARRFPPRRSALAFPGWRASTRASST